MTAPGEASRAERARSQPLGGSGSVHPPPGDHEGEDLALALRRTDAAQSDPLAAQPSHHPALLRTLLGQLDLAVLIEDGDGRVVDVNEAFVALLDIPLSVEDLVGAVVDEVAEKLPRSFTEALRGPDQERFSQLLSSGLPRRRERLALSAGRVLERDFAPVDGAPSAMRMFVFRDVSSQAESEAEWEELLESQREENRRLHELDRVKSEFLAEISHELRTPLTSILSFTDLLSSGLGSQDLDEQREYVEVIGRNASRLLRLVDDLLLLDRIERGSLPVEWRNFDMPSVVSASVSSFTPAANRKGVSLESALDDGPPLCGDAQRIAQLLDVVISNAIKFTPELGRVLVTACPSETGWSIDVADSGIGIPPHEQESLFERFYRASNARAARLPGSGLGLSIARAIADLHGGSIEIKPSQPQGTLVSIRLPYPVLRTRARR